MKIYELFKIGDFHFNHCEDYGVVANLGKDKILCAVMDGCTMGTDSYLASTLTGKFLRKIAKEIDYKEFIHNTNPLLLDLLKDITRKLFQELRTVKNQIQLDREELLCTLILIVVDTESRKGECLTIGDGLIYHNGVVTEYEQDNKPDYLGYHLAEDFEAWYVQQKQTLSLSDIEHLSISTDGIFTFQKFDNKSYQVPKNLNIIDCLLKDYEDVDNESMLRNKVIKIEKEWGLKLTDDLGIIRIFLPPQ
jgi:hypothetical protein